MKNVRIFLEIDYFCYVIYHKFQLKPGISAMKNKNISYQSGKLLAHLNTRNKQFFTISDASEVFPGNKQKTTFELINDMVKRGLVLRIRNGLYHVIPYEAESSTYFPNWHLVAESLAKEKDHYIGFYSALDIHGLITQPSLKEQIVTKKQVRPKNQRIRNRKFEFITLKENHFFGYKKQWINNFNKVQCSTIEKTIIDCLYLPGYGGGIVEIGKALYKARKAINEYQLLEYLLQFNVQVVIKRIGYLCDSLGLFTNLTNEISKDITSSYTLLDPSHSKGGISTSKWRVIDNINIYEIIDNLKT